MNRGTTVGVVLLGLFAFLFFVSVVYVEPHGIFRCPASGCTFPDYASVTYWTFNIGGVWMEHFTLIPKHYYYTVIL